MDKSRAMPAAALVALLLGTGLVVACTGNPATVVEDELGLESGDWSGTFTASFMAAGGAWFVHRLDIRQQGRDLFGTFLVSATQDGCVVEGQASLAGRADNDDEWAELRVRNGANSRDDCSTHTVVWKDQTLCTARMSVDRRWFSCNGRRYERE